MELRDYQREAIEALEKFFREKDGNPCIVLPTGSGKSFVMAEIIRRRLASNPLFRCIVLAHRQELVQQNHDEFIELMCEPSRSLAGIYCAGLGRSDVNAQVTFANIASVCKRATKFPRFDMIMVDEAHHIPVKDNGMYRGFITEAKARNLNMRIVGLTATPYRLGVGYVCHKDYVLNEVCYEANVRDLIDAGHLSRLRSKISKKKSPDLKNVPKCGGEYKIDALSSCVRRSNLVHDTIRDALDRLDKENRKYCIWFCVDVKHCEMVREALIEHGQEVAMVTGDTPQKDREELIERFKNGALRHLLNVEVFTEGFNVKQVDAIVLLRPTLSRGLYSQMVGRGLRIHPGKDDCIVLDYARCISRHGPIDQESDKFVPMEVCPHCEELFARELKKCPKCGYVVPVEALERHDKGDERRKRVRELHDAIAADDEILEREHGCGRTLRVVNGNEDVERWLLAFAYVTARGDTKYDIKKFRNLGDALNEFIEYARYVELTNLPEMLKHYFEYDGWHRSEQVVVRAEENRVSLGNVERVQLSEVLLEEAFSKCRHCGSICYGQDCTPGSRNTHEHIGNEENCEWCGSSEYGRICIYSPYLVHRHGHGANKCIWCGSTKDGDRCFYSPTGRHEK